MIYPLTWFPANEGLAESVCLVNEERGGKRSSHPFLSGWRTRAIRKVNKPLPQIVPSKQNCHLLKAEDVDLNHKPWYTFAVNTRSFHNCSLTSFCYSKPACHLLLQPRVWPESKLFTVHRMGELNGQIWEVPPTYLNLQLPRPKVIHSVAVLLGPLKEASGHPLVWFTL